MELQNKKHLWILEDELSSRFVYEEALGIRYFMSFFSSVRDFKNAVQEKNLPDLVIADLRMPGESFLDFLALEKHTQRPTFPFIIVSSVDDADVLRYCFEEGAFDYLTKPFKVNELIVKLERLLSKAPPVSPESETDDLIIDSSTLRLKKADKNPIQLTAKEHQIFSLLYKNKMKKVARHEIVQYVWDDVRVGTKTLDVHLFNLRRKIEPIHLEIKFFPPHFFQLCPLEEVKSHSG